MCVSVSVLYVCLSVNCVCVFTSGYESVFVCGCFTDQIDTKCCENLVAN